MKKLLIVLVLVSSMSVFAKEAKLVNDKPNYRVGLMTEWTPFALTICGPVGLPWGDWNINGFQLGLINSVYELSGLQLGVVNIADRAYGVQIGIINVISSNDIPFMPLVNWNF